MLQRFVVSRTATPPIPILSSQTLRHDKFKLALPNAILSGAGIPEKLRVPHEYMLVFEDFPTAETKNTVTTGLGELHTSDLSSAIPPDGPKPPGPRPEVASSSSAAPSRNCIKHNNVRLLEMSVHVGLNHQDTKQTSLHRASPQLRHRFAAIPF